MRKDIPVNKDSRAEAEDGKPARKRRNFQPWDVFNSTSGPSYAIPLLFAPHMVGLGQEFQRILQGRSDISPDSNDHRFDDGIWHNNPIYKASMQSYLAWCRNLEDLIDTQLRGQADKHDLLSAAQYLCETLSPNQPSVNMKAMRRLFETRGASLVQGMQRVSQDYFYSYGLVQTPSEQKLSLGTDVAATAGGVIFRSRQLELIQYQPATAQVYATPLLIVASPIHKYYLSDLSATNSLTKFLLEQGFQVFVTSWKNPGHKAADWNLNTYLEALLDGCRVIAEISAGKELNLFGHSAGGILAVMAASLAPRCAENPRIKSISLASVNLDLQAHSQGGLKVNTAILEASKMLSAMSAAADAKEIANLFAWMRPNNLIWNAWVSNYFLNEDIPSGDVRVWNADTNRIPAALMQDLLDLCAANPSLERGQLKLGKEQLELSNALGDAYILMGSMDHIAPWESCLENSLVLGGKKTFVLVNRGHVRSLICPPNDKACRYFTHDELPTNADDWLSEADMHPGSWWPHWADWLSQRSSDKRGAPKKLGNRNFSMLSPAPGDYVSQ